MNIKYHKQQHTSSVSSSKAGGRDWAFYIVLLALLLFFALYTAVRFPYTYITLEGDDFWVLTWDYWHLKLAMLPALTNWLADYFMQFYGSVPVAACIQTLVLGAVGLLAHSVLIVSFRRWGGWLALLPPILLGFYCTFNLSFQMQCLFFFGLIKIFMLIPNKTARLFYSILCVPLGFLLMCTPLLALLLMSQFLITWISDKFHIVWTCPLLLLMVTPLLYSELVAFIPFEKRYTDFGTDFDPLTSQYNRDGEYVRKCVCLANEGRWEDLLYKEHLKSDARRGNGIALRYGLLAECALGIMPENLLDYPISDENLFLYPHESSYVAQQFNRLFYLNLGIYDEAYHHAEEYGLLLRNGNNFSSLRQMIDYSIEEGEWEIAEKFLKVLSQTTCHRHFIQERRAKLAEARKNFNKDIPLRADNFVGGYSMPVEMLRLARYYKDSPEKKKMVDYAICAYIIRGDYNSFMIALNAFDIYKDKELPKAYEIFKDNFK